MSHDTQKTTPDPVPPNKTEIPRSNELGKDDLDAVAGGLAGFRPSIPNISIGTRLPTGEADVCITRL